MLTRAALAIFPIGKLRRVAYALDQFRIAPGAVGVFAGMPLHIADVCVTNLLFDSDFSAALHRGDRRWRNVREFVGGVVA